MSKYPGLKRRGSRGIYQLRLAIPRDLHAVFGRKEVTVSLRTSDSQKAVDRYFIEVGRFRAVFADCRKAPAGDFSLKPVAEGFNEQSTNLLPLISVPATGPLLSKTVEAWFSSPKK